MAGEWDAPMVSVVMPAFNRQGLLLRAAMSVLGQTYPALELIIVDDGSTDATVEVARSIADPRVRVEVLPTNSGAPVARNRGIDLAQGEFVAFIDSDDEWLPAKLERQVRAALATSHASLVVCGRKIVDPGGEELGRRGTPASGWSFFATLRETWSPSTVTFLVPRWAIGTVRFDPELPCRQDFDLALQLLRRGELCAVPESLAIVHHHPGPRVRMASIAAAYRRLAVTYADDLEADTRSFVQFHLRWARALANEGNRAEAVRILLRAWRRDPQNPKPLRALFRLFVVGGSRRGVTRA